MSESNEFRRDPHFRNQLLLQYLRSDGLGRRNGLYELEENIGRRLAHCGYGWPATALPQEEGQECVGVLHDVVPVYVADFTGIEPAEDVILRRLQPHVVDLPVEQLPPPDSGTDPVYCVIAASMFRRWPVGSGLALAGAASLPVTLVPVEMPVTGAVMDRLIALSPALYAGTVNQIGGHLQDLLRACFASLAENVPSLALDTRAFRNDGCAEDRVTALPRVSLPTLARRDEQRQQQHAAVSRKYFRQRPDVRLLLDQIVRLWGDNRGDDTPQGLRGLIAALQTYAEDLES
jgi:hypothetical protein